MSGCSRSTLHSLADEKAVRARLNNYLFDELGICEGREEVSQKWPFHLREISSSEAQERDVRVFVFNHRQEIYYAQAGRTLSFWAAEGMTIEDLHLHIAGAGWIERQAPVDLDTVRTGDPTIPSIGERRRAMEEIARRALDRSAEVHILEGLFFPGRGACLALVEDNEGRALVVGTGIEVYPVRHSEAAPWRRLYVAVGEMLKSGRLPWPDVPEAKR